LTRPRLTFGYLFDFRNPSEFARPATELYAETLDLIAWTESAGFEGAWVPEHHVADDGYMPTPNVMLAAIVARTSRIRIGSAVALAPLYDPVRCAEECAVLDILSGGRVEMALAIGYRRREYEALGLPFGQRGSRFDAFLEIVRRLWAGETVDHADAHFQIRGARLTPPAPRGRIPLYIGGFADKALERVARHADGYFGNEEFAAPYAAKLAAIGKDPAAMRIRLQGLTTVIAEDPAAAMEELAPYYLVSHNAYAAWAAEDAKLGMAGMKPMDLDAYKRSGALQIWTPEEAITRYTALRERVPVEHVMFSRPPGLPADRFRHYAKLFADRVLPIFA
jgi:alkanesulfonate monooxygenase SsuD/methylene tetrahydromethanopterin reductase-like flavin-dependent oxidoreductase (luciferase family)